MKFLVGGLILPIISYCVMASIDIIAEESIAIYKNVKKKLEDTK